MIRRAQNYSPRLAEGTKSKKMRMVSRRRSLDASPEPLQPWRTPATGAVTASHLSRLTAIRSAGMCSGMMRASRTCHWWLSCAESLAKSDRLGARSTARNRMSSDEPAVLGGVTIAAARVGLQPATSGRWNKAGVETGDVCQDNACDNGSHPTASRDISSTASRPPRVAYMKLS